MTAGGEEPGFEAVHTVTDYLDQPREGIADFKGVPHFYEREYDQGQGEYTQRYYLTPIESSTFALALERWRIWVRWRSAVSRGRVGVSADPPLPEDQSRYSELKSRLNSKLTTDHGKAFLVGAEFRRTTGNWAEDPPGFVVRWIP